MAQWLVRRHLATRARVSAPSADVSAVIAKSHAGPRAGTRDFAPSSATPLSSGEPLALRAPARPGPIQSGREVSTPTGGTPHVPHACAPELDASSHACVPRPLLHQVLVAAHPTQPPTSSYRQRGVFLKKTYISKDLN